MGAVIFLFLFLVLTVFSVWCFLFSFVVLLSDSGDGGKGMSSGLGEIWADISGFYILFFICFVFNIIFVCNMVSELCWLLLTRVFSVNYNLF